ncbi:SUMO ligase [Pichia kluyveri]|uniref:SUMO ligase n=1 Tax=Pichia kluyveri TaxID=36015 RepID=A0AAV5QX71_PICKL|nr:SUMO ligase [Pichia kluyveri]
MEEYLYCGICYKNIRDTTLYLTSCAHVICEEHVERDYCNKCKNRGVSIIKIEKDLNLIEDNIRDIIEPSYEKLSNLQFGNKFQFEQMKGLIDYYKNNVKNLREKNNRLKELLRKSRNELDKCSGYQKEIEELKKEIKDRDIKERSLSNGKGIEFVNKLKKFSMKSRENSVTREDQRNNDQRNDNNNHIRNMSIQAESTNINTSSIIRSNLSSSKIGNGGGNRGRIMSSMGNISSSLSSSSSSSSRMGIKSSSSSSINGSNNMNNKRIKSRQMMFKPPISRNLNNYNKR